MTISIASRRMATLFVGLAAALLATCLTGGPVAAATEVPAQVNVKDPANDANAVNDQGAAYYVDERGDHQGPANLDSRADILAVWFSNTRTVLSVHVQTAANPPTPTAAYGFRVYANPTDEQPQGCTTFEALVSGPTWRGESQARIRDLCLRPGTGTTSELFARGPVTTEDGRDGTGILTMAFEVGTAPMIEACDVIVKPRADSRYVIGPASPFLMAPVLDNTKAGSDYRILPPPRSRKHKAKQPAPVCPS